MHGVCIVRIYISEAFLCHYFFVITNWFEEKAQELIILFVLLLVVDRANTTFFLRMEETEVQSFLLHKTHCILEHMKLSPYLSMKSHLQ